MNRTLAAALACVAFLLLILGLAKLRVEPDPARTSQPAVSAPDGSIAALQEIVALLQGQVELTQSLQVELANDLNPLQSEVHSLAEERPEGAASSTSLRRRVESDEPLPARAPGAGVRFHDDALLAAGFRREEVAAFRSRLDGIELERLYLRDRAIRDGEIVRVEIPRGPLGVLLQPSSQERSPTRHAAGTGR